MQLGEAQEYPLPGSRPSEGWCENYALVANDPTSGIGLCLYQGRQPFDIDIWHEIVLLRVPDGRTLAWKSAGRGGALNGGGGAITTFTCETPGRAWRARLDGFTWAVTAMELDAGPLHDGPWTPTTLDLRFVGAGPPWALGDASLEHAQEHMHYEQLGTVTGTVTAGDERWELDGTGHRDHSRGPRDFRGVLDHAWVNCLFPDGRSFALYRMRLPDGSDGVAAAGVFDGERLHHARVVSMPLLAETDDHDAYEIVLEIDGETVRIGAEILHTIGVVSYVTPNHMAIGRCTDPAACQVVFERTTRFTWGGEVGYGHTQRSVAAHP